jgi:hypothetical protein
MAKLTSIEGFMAFILFVGAAVHDANEEQRARLNLEMPPLLDAMRDKESYKREMAAVMEGVLEIMGDDWQMDEESRKWIDVLLEDR